MSKVTTVSASATPHFIPARSRTRGGPVARAARVAGRDLVYLTGVLGTSIVGFVAWTVGLSLALSLSVLVVGALVWVAVAGGLRATVDLDRRLVGWYRGASLNGRYRHQVAGTLTLRLKATLADPRTWADLRWLVLNSVFGFVCATLALAVTAEVISLVAMPLWWWAISDPHQPAELLAKLRRAAAARVGELELSTRRQLVLGLVAMIKSLNAQIKELERQLTRTLGEHPDGEIFRSLFRDPRSVICAAELLAEIGDCRGRYPSRDSLAADAGQAAVAIESGKRKAACFRWGCNKRLRAAFATLADSTRHWHPWAQDVYAAALARGHDHPRALRTLGRAWCRVVWQCWQKRTPYDPARHRALQQHITVTIPTASGPVVDQLATESMAAGLFATNAPHPRQQQVTAAQ